MEKLKNVATKVKEYVDDNMEWIAPMITGVGCMTLCWISWGKGLQAGMSLQASHDAELISMINTTYNAAEKLATAIKQ